ncbi:hypothetical protein F5Y14DRAFT_64470 [Nemania sp. NC0429]|nr:hypothetical protein F5Y14DRAFT_64470 [Nemania sp. NC0429]
MKIGSATYFGNAAPRHDRPISLATARRVSLRGPWQINGSRKSTASLHCAPSRAGGRSACRRIEFSALVGYSSGEIGASYAAGYLSATDAIRVAYYGGVHSHLAQGPGGKRGRMMAVGMSLAQATTFCSEFDGTLAVAAGKLGYQTMVPLPKSDKWTHRIILIT